ncbi:FHA domain-containing protein [Undibacterium sp. Di24W]|uniref:FHA domain-containing protein n=1 Tax=Undibacterium sp. Di24W TaxID=3413033 RepID=UPI003BF28D49
MNKFDAFDLTPSQLATTLCKPSTEPTTHLHLRFSGYDPRAVGGRQTLKLELHGELSPTIREVGFCFRSDLFLPSQSEQSLSRTPTGFWPPFILSFSSKNREHGQYPLEVQLHYIDEFDVPHLWTCTATLFLPRPNASLSEIHQVFLATQKQVRVVAEDGAIAKLSGLQQAHDSRHTNLDIAIYAKDAAIAQLDMTGTRANEGGKFDIGLSSIAWDETLLEVAVPSIQSLTGKRVPAVLSEPIPTERQFASLVIRSSAKETSALPAIRLFASKEWLFGRMDMHNSVADVLLGHNNPVFVRRISAKHAILRRNDEGGLELVDISRYGVMVDGVILEKNRAILLLPGMQIEFCASFKGIVRLRVAQILPHAAVLQRLNETRIVEMLYLMTPESHPGAGQCDQNQSLHLPIFFHRQRQFWYHHAQTKQDRPLAVDVNLSEYQLSLRNYRYYGEPYPESIPSAKS